MHRQTPPDPASRAGFTILEIATVIVVISILAIMAVGTYSSLRGKADRARCANNLRSLYVAAVAYLEEHESWPQIPTKDFKKPPYAEAWIAQLRPYGIDRPNWICPSIQYSFGNPDYVNNPRVDYFATPFGPELRAAYKWSNYPWFIERADVHGDGNLIIFTNGNLRSIGGK